MLHPNPRTVLRWFATADETRILRYTSEMNQQWKLWGQGQRKELRRKQRASCRLRRRWPVFRKSQEMGYTYLLAKWLDNDTKVLRSVIGLLERQTEKRKEWSRLYHRRNCSLTETRTNQPPKLRDLCLKLVPRHPIFSRFGPVWFVLARTLENLARQEKIFVRRTLQRHRKCIFRYALPFILMWQGFFFKKKKEYHLTNCAPPSMENICYETMLWEKCGNSAFLTHLSNSPVIMPFSLLMIDIRHPLFTQFQKIIQQTFTVEACMRCILFLFCFVHGSNCINCKCTPLQFWSNVKYLGITFDSDMKWNTNFTVISKKLRSVYCLLYNSRHLLQSSVRKVIVHALVYSYLKYGITIFYHCTFTWRAKLNSILKSILRNFAHNELFPLIIIYFTFYSCLHLMHYFFPDCGYKTFLGEWFSFSAGPCMTTETPWQIYYPEVLYPFWPLYKTALWS